MFFYRLKFSMNYCASWHFGNHSGLFGIVQDNSGPFGAVRDCSRQFMTVRDYSGSFRTVRDSSRQFGVAWDCSRQLVTIRDRSECWGCSEPMFGTVWDHSPCWNWGGTDDHIFYGTKSLLKWVLGFCSFLLDGDLTEDKEKCMGHLSVENLEEAPRLVWFKKN